MTATGRSIVHSIERFGVISSRPLESRETVARSRPFTPSTIMNVGSIAKPITGVAMMRAIQEGKLSLDADINWQNTCGREVDYSGLKI